MENIARNCVCVMVSGDYFEIGSNTPQLAVTQFRNPANSPYCERVIPRSLLRLGYQRAASSRYLLVFKSFIISNNSFSAIVERMPFNEKCVLATLCPAFSIAFINGVYCGM